MLKNSILISGLLGIISCLVFVIAGNVIIYAISALMIGLFFLYATLLFLFSSRLASKLPELQIMKKGSKSVFVVIFLVMISFFFYQSFLGFQDTPKYLSGHYNVISGTPSEVNQTHPSTDEKITIKGRELTLRNGGINGDSYKNQTFTFKFLPHTGWIMNYSVK